MKSPINLLDEKKRIVLEETLVNLKKESIRKHNVLWERFLKDYETAMQFLQMVQLKQTDMDTAEEHAQKLVKCIMGRMYLNNHLPARFTAIEQLKMLAELNPFINALVVGVAA